MKPLGTTALGLALLLAPALARASFYGPKHGPLPQIAPPSAQGPVSQADIDIIENIGQRVPAGLVFTDGHGGKVALDEVLARGKPVLLTLGYFHCPMLCNLVHEGLAKAIKEAKLALGQDFNGLAVSIDPNEDPKSANTNQARLMRFLMHDQRNDWPFVMGTAATGEKAPHTLAQAVGFRYKYDPSSKLFAHSALAVVLTPRGIISRYMYDVKYSARDLRLAIVEGGEGRVGTALDRVLLACFKYDPMAQRYTPYAVAFVRIGAMLSFIALFSLLAVLWRRELVMRRRRTA
jgi:protein SCO1/2